MCAGPYAMHWRAHVHRDYRLGAGYREAITKAIELLRIEGIGPKTALQKHLDDRSMRGLDGYRDLRRRGLRLLQQPSAQVRQSSSFMTKFSLTHNSSTKIEQADVVLLGCPIDTDQPMNVFCHGRAPIGLWAYRDACHFPVLALEAQTSYWTSVAAVLPGTGPTQVLGHGWAWWLRQNRPVRPVYMQTGRRTS